MLTSMDDYVLGQVPHIHKGLATHAALVWSDVVMVANVIGQLAGLDESIGPQITRLMLTHRSYGVCGGVELRGYPPLWDTAWDLASCSLEWGQATTSCHSAHRRRASPPCVGAHGR